MERRQQREGNLEAIQHGWGVYDAADQQVGTVDGVEDGYILAHKGIFFPTDLYIPASAIARIADDRVSLNVVKSDVDDQRWDSVPTGRTAGPGTTMDTAETMEAPRERAAAERSAERTALARGAAGEQTLHLHEEELRVNKERVQAGEVRLGKEVVEEQKTVNVPVRREEVVIERTAGNRRPDGHSIDEGAGQTIRVPLSEEQVSVDKVTVQTEEVGVGKRQVQENRQVTETVKHEEARIEETGDVHVAGKDAAAGGKRNRR